MKNRTISILAAGGVAAVALTLIGTGAQAAGPDLEVLSTAKDVSSELEKGISLENFGDGGLDKQVVELAATKEATIWAAQDASDNVCLVINPANTDLYSSSCIAPTDFQDKGTFLAVESGSASPTQFYLEAYLVPDSAADTMSSRAEFGLTKVGSNLLVGDTRMTEGATLELKSADEDGEFTLNLVGSTK